MRCPLALASISVWLSSCSSALVAGPCRVTPLPGPTWAISNGLVERHVSLFPSGPKTVLLGLNDGLVGFEFDEFLLRLEGGREVGPADFSWTAAPEQTPVGDGLSLALQGEGKAVPLRIRLVYTILPGKPYMWKQVALQATGDGKVLLRDVQVERAKAVQPSAKADLGGLGQPVFLGDRAFWGLEYPAADNLQRDGVIALEHHPGVWLDGSKWWYSKRAVFGIARDGDAAAAFRRYLADIRRPPRSYVVYNSWYDVQRGEMNVPVLIDRARQFHEELTAKRGAPFDAAALDDCWQDRQSIWEIDQVGFPNAFRDLYDGLKPMNVSIGLWHPLTAMMYNLDTEWGLKNGYEVSPDKAFFCLSGPRYNAALREELRRHTTEYGIDYFKHDFNAFACAGEGHGHLPEAVYGREANVDAEIEMFRFLSRVHPGVYLNPSGGMWLSPWWLKYVDTVWMQWCDDFGYSKGVVACEPRDWEMTYRDGALYQNLHVDRVQFPVSAIMTIGLIDGKLNRLGGENEPLDRWANNVLVNMGRGSMLKELYLTPALLSPQQWDVLASALKWQQQFVGPMATGRMLPLDPRQDRIYGWVHANRNGGFICLRNPGIVSRTITVDLPELQGDSIPAYRVYPWRESVPVTATPGRPSLTTAVEPFGVTVIELGPQQGAREPVVEGARASIAARKPGEITYDIWSQPGSTAQVTLGFPHAELSSIETDQGLKLAPHGHWKQIPLQFPGRAYHLSEVRADEAGRTFGVTVDPGVKWQFVVAARDLPKTWSLTLSVDGQPAPTRRVPGEGWDLLMCPVPEGEHEVGWAAPSQDAAPPPFSSRAYRIQPFFVREATLQSIRVKVTYPPQPGPLAAIPETPFAGVERTTWAGPEVTVEPSSGPTQMAVTEADLANAKAAKLHLSVFGSQGGDDYGRKWVVLNGRRVAAVPANSNASQPDRWEEFITDLAPEHVKLLRLENEVVIERQTADCFKLGDLALAVQRPDGLWAETDHDPTIWCSAPGWLFDEGTHFGDRTPGIRLRFQTP